MMDDTSPFGPAQEMLEEEGISDPQGIAPTLCGAVLPPAETDPFATGVKEMLPEYAPAVKAVAAVQTQDSHVIQRFLDAFHSKGF